MAKIINFTIFIVFQTIVALVLFNKSPLTMDVQPPSSKSPWADQPMRLITTPQFETQKARPSFLTSSSCIFYAFAGYQLTLRCSLD